MPTARTSTLVATVSIAALALVGCSSAEAETTPAGETLSYTWERNTAGEDEEPTFETTSVDVPVNPESIVVFDMASLDTIGALGGEVAGAPLESVPDYLQGSLADDAFNAGTLFEADLIEIEAQQPDLIVIGGRSAGLWEELNDIAPTIDMTGTGTYVERLEANATFLGQVLDAEDEAQAQVDELLAQIDTVSSEVAGLGTGLGIMVSGGELSALAPAGDNPDGRNLRGGIIYDVFGTQPVVEDVESATHGEPISFEFVLEHNPDVLWVIDRDAATGESTQAAEAVLDNEIMAQTAAAQNGNIHYLEPTAWYIVFGGLQTTQVMIDDVSEAVA